MKSSLLIPPPQSELCSPRFRDYGPHQRRRTRKTNLVHLTLSFGGQVCFVLKCKPLENKPESSLPVYSCHPHRTGNQFQTFHLAAHTLRNTSPLIYYGRSCAAKWYGLRPAVSTSVMTVSGFQSDSLFTSVSLHCFSGLEIMLLEFQHVHRNRDDFSVMMNIAE